MRAEPLGSRLRIAGLALAGFVVAVYALGLRGPFIFDDYANILAMTAPRDGTPWLERLLGAQIEVSRPRVLPNLSFMLQDAAFGDGHSVAPAGYKLFNLLLHLACGGAVFALARLALRTWGVESRRAAWWALAAAALFLLHPLQVSTVLYAVQRMALCAALFALLACHAYLRWRLEGGARRLAAVGLYAALALASKENAALLPLAFAVIELTVLRDAATARAGGFEPRTVRHVAALALTLAAGALLLTWHRIVGDYAIRDYTLPQRLLTEIHVLADYVRTIAWPNPDALSFYHDDFPIRRALDVSTALLAAAFAATLALAARARATLRPLAFAIGWFFAWHALEAGIIALEMKFEHRNYLPLAGVAIGAAGLSAGARLPPRAKAAALLALGAALAAVTVARVRDWSSYDAFVAHEARLHPGSIRAQSAFVERRATVEIADAPTVPAAREALQRLAQALPDSASVAVMQLGLDCVAPAAPVAVPDVMRRFEQGQVEAEAHRLLGAIVQSRLGGHCASVAYPDLARAIGATLANPGIAARPALARHWQFLSAQTEAGAGEPARAFRTMDALAQQHPEVYGYQSAAVRFAIAAGDAASARAALARVRAWAARTWMPPRAAIAAIEREVAMRFDPERRP